MERETLVGQDFLIIEVSRSHSDTPHAVGLHWTSDPLPDNTQHSQETGIDAHSGIRTCNLSKRAAAEPCLRPRGHWDQLEQDMRDSQIKTLKVR
jgi:hypothetical protein